jgi:hypothetical protein
MDIREVSGLAADFHRESPTRTMKAVSPGKYMVIEF